MYALTDINEGDEITYDYSLTVGIHSDWKMNCLCKTETCRKIIGNILTIPSDHRENFIHNNVLPDFIKIQLNKLKNRDSNLLTTKLLMEAANFYKLPIQHYGYYTYAKISLANKLYFFYAGITPFNDGCSSHISCNKYLMSYFLREAGFPVLVTNVISKINCVNGKWVLPKLDYPIVAKPGENSGCGVDVFCNIKDESTLIEYLNETAHKYSFILIEKFEAKLTTYRVLVFYNKVIGVTRLEPPGVTGDGKHSIAELIEIENGKRRKFVPILEAIKIDRECEALLKEFNRTLCDVPKPNEKITLSYTCNTERGGTDFSLGKSICPENAKLFCKAAKVIGLNLVGFDVLCEDIQRPIEKTRGFIVDANYNPDITYHQAPAYGRVMPITHIFLRRLIRRHPFAYSRLYCNYIWNKYSFWLKGIFAISMLPGVVKFIKLFQFL